MTADQLRAAWRAHCLERCADRRVAHTYPLADGSESTHEPYCAGYYERGLRCPGCPEDDADELDMLSAARSAFTVLDEERVGRA